MKRYISPLIFLALPALALLTGCAADGNEPPMSEPDPTQSIVFGQAAASGGIDSQKQASTPSRSTLLNALPEGAQTRVYGYCVPLSVSLNDDPASATLPWVQKANYSVPDVFPGSDTSEGNITGTTLTVNNGRLKYDGTPKPWLTGSNLDADAANYTFISHYPAAGAFTYSRHAVAANSRTGAPRFTFTMPAAAASDHTAIPDAMVAAKFDHQKSDGQVHFTYRHILTALRFQINNYSAEELTLTSISLEGDFFNSAAFTFNTGEIVQTTAATTFHGNWDLTPAAGSMTVASNSGRPLGDGTRGTSVLLLPDPAITPSAGNNTDCLGSNKKLHVAYSIGTTPYTQDLDVKLLFKPAGGTSYALNLNFVGNEFVIFFQPTDLWENGSDNGIVIN